MNNEYGFKDTGLSSYNSGKSSPNHGNPSTSGSEVDYVNNSEAGGTTPKKIGTVPTPPMSGPVQPKVGE